MLPMENLDATTTGDGLRLELLRRGDDYYIHFDREELMSSRHTRSETELARLAVEAFRATSKRREPARVARVLVGGLGMGYTLRAALDAAPEAEVTVAEIFQAVIDWNRQWLGPLNGSPLDDPRTRLVHADVTDVVKEGRNRPFDAILLDVDNGPTAMCLASNQRLYSRRGLEHLDAALVPGGVLGIWSSGEVPRFAKRLDRMGFNVTTHRPRDRGRGRRHIVYLARTLDRRG